MSVFAWGTDRWKVIGLIVDILRNSLKEKVIRISLATLRVR